MKVDEESSNCDNNHRELKLNLPLALVFDIEGLVEVEGHQRVDVNHAGRESKREEELAPIVGDGLQHTLRR